MKKSAKKRVRKFGRANRCRNPRNWFTSLQSEAYSAECRRVKSTVGGFSSRRLRQLLQQRYNVKARIHILERKLLSIVEILFRCPGFSYTAEFIAVVFATNCSRACILKPKRTPNCAILLSG